MQGEAVAEAGSYSEAEGLFLRAKQPELALQMYRKALMWEDALRIAEDYLPARVWPNTLSIYCGTALLLL